MDVLLSELNFPSLSRPTASLVFGIVISFSSGALLLLALGTQAWAVRQEVVLLTTGSLQDELESRLGRRGSAGEGVGDRSEGHNKGIDTDFGKVQINIPVEVPTLRIDDLPDQDTFYNEKLDELYTTRLEEMYKNSATYDLPRESSLRAISFSKLKSVLSKENYLNESLSKDKSVTLLNFKTRLKRHKINSISVKNLQTKEKNGANNVVNLGMVLRKELTLSINDLINNLGSNNTLESLHNITIDPNEQLINNKDFYGSKAINKYISSPNNNPKDNQSTARNQSSYSYLNSTSSFKGNDATVLETELRSKSAYNSESGRSNNTLKSLEQELELDAQIFRRDLHHRPSVPHHSRPINASISLPRGMKARAKNKEEKTKEGSMYSGEMETSVQGPKQRSYDHSTLLHNTSSIQQDSSSFYRDPRPIHHDLTPLQDDSNLLHHGPSSLHHDPSSLHHDSSSHHHVQSPFHHDPSSLHHNTSPMDHGRDGDPVHFQKRSTFPVLHSSPLVLQFSVCLWRVCVNVVAPSTVNVSQFCCSVFARLPSPSTSRGSWSAMMGELPPLMALTPALTSATSSLLHTLRCSCCVVALAALVMILATSLSVRSFVMARQGHGEHSCVKDHPLVTVGNLQPPSISTNSSLAPKASAGEAEIVETATSARVPLSRQQLLPVASALFAVAGIMMGGGVFHFCSAVTEKPVTPMPHPAQFSSAPNPSSYDRNYSSYQPGAMLRWPLLMAANCVIGCFLAALATGYAFFSTWDKQMLTFFNKGDSSNELISCNQSSYDGIEFGCKTQTLCDRCKNGKESIVFNADRAPHGLNASAPGFNRCCQTEYCCSSNSTLVNYKPCGGNSSQASSSGSSLGCTYAEYSKDKLHLHDIKRDCVQCMWEHNIRCCKEGPQSHNVNLSKPASTASYEMEAFRAKINNQRVEGRYVGSKPCLGHSDSVSNHEKTKADLSSDQFNSSSEVKLHDKTISKLNDTGMGLCDDPICQREQLSRYKTPLPLDSVIFEPSTQQRSQHCQQEMPSRNFNQFDYFHNKRTSNSDLTGDFLNRRDHFQSSKNSLLEAINGTEHLYSNYFIQNTNPAQFPVEFIPSDKNISSYSMKPIMSKQQSVPDGCSYCTNDQIALTNSSDSGSRTFDEVHSKSCASRETSFQQGYQTQPMSLTSNHHFRQPYANTRAYSNSYSTLPANFSLKDSFSLSDTNEDVISRKREYKSCLNINENRFSSLDLRRSSITAHHYSNYSLRNSSVASLHGRMEDFERRKTVKSVKFITPDDEEDGDVDDNEEDEADGGDDDSDYYVKKPLRSSIKQSRRDFLPPEGSSPKLDGFRNGSPLFR